MTNLYFQLGQSGPDAVLESSRCRFWLESPKFLGEDYESVYFGLVLVDSSTANPYSYDGSCSLDGLPMPCSVVSYLAEAGMAGAVRADVYIKYASGKTARYSGFVDTSLGGIHQTWRGGAAQAAAKGFLKLLPYGIEAGIRGAFASVALYTAQVTEKRKNAHAQQDTRTVCDRMAADAQRVAGEMRDDYPKATAAWALQEFNKRYGQVTFGSYFAETPLGFLGTRASGRDVIGNRSYQGDSGFPEQFRDTLKPGEDQVHHFGAFFSAGLAGHKIVPDLHRADDRDVGNTGDVQLGDQSRRLGDYLRRNPNELSNIGNLIKDVICGAGAVPK